MLIILVAAMTALVIGYRADLWVVRTGLGTAIVMVALGMSVLIGHLFFLGAQFLLGPAGRQELQFTDDEIDRDLPGPPGATAASRPPGYRSTWCRWAQLAAPGLGEAGGLLQKGVSEIYSSDVPPFYKGFLRLDTTPDQLVISLHQVFGKVRIDLGGGRHDRPAAG